MERIRAIVVPLQSSYLTPRYIRVNIVVKVQVLQDKEWLCPAQVSSQQDGNLKRLNGMIDMNTCPPHTATCQSPCSVITEGEQLDKYSTFLPRPKNPHLFTSDIVTCNNQIVEYTFESIFFYNKHQKTF